MHKPTLPLLLILLSTGPVTALAAGPREKEAWYAYMADGQRYGRQHVVVTRQPDGSFRYATHTRVLINLFGVQKQEMIGESVWVVDRNYRPISVQMRGQSATGSKAQSGRIEDGLLVIRDEGGDGPQSTVSLDDGPIPDVCLDDWIADRADQSELTVSVIRPDEWSRDTVTLTRTRTDDDGHTWQMKSAVSPSHGSVQYDRAGHVREMTLKSPSLHLVSCSREEAEDIDYWTMAGREVLMFPIKEEIGNLARLTELTVRLRWKDIALERFELEDLRQRLVSHTEKDGQHEAVVRISAPPALDSTRTLPIRDESLAAYLATTRYIEPEHPAIAAQAREIVGDSKTAMQAVRALAGWVSDYVEGSMPAETLSGSQVLECKTGKCTEYTTLFASLARAAGIPTRVALGERIMGTHWGGHMWNEVYVDRWIPVDASVNEVGESFALLKFIHSDTVMGTQELRWALTESLEITVAESKSRPSTLAERFTTGIDGRTYTNTDYACRIAAPQETWVLEDKSTAGTALVRFRIPERDEVLIHFVAYGLPAGTPPKAIISARLQAFRTNMKDFDLQVDEPREIGGLKGHQIRFARAPGGDEPGPMLTTEIVWVAGTTGYLLNIIAPEDGHRAFHPQFEELLTRFEHLRD